MSQRLKLCVLSFTLLISGCATTTGRFVTGALVGGTCGGAGGVLLSPNKESKNLNALVFGVSGALLGGVLGLLFDQVSPSKSNYDLRTNETKIDANLKSYLAPNANNDLPEYLKKRVKPAVIESYMERDKLSEDGVLHEPHRAYRIAQGSELLTEPLPEQNDKEGVQK